MVITLQYYLKKLRFYRSFLGCCLNLTFLVNYNGEAISIALDWRSKRKWLETLVESTTHFSDPPFGCGLVHPTKIRHNSAVIVENKHKNFIPNNTITYLDETPRIVRAIASCVFYKLKLELQEI